MAYSTPPPYGTRSASSPATVSPTPTAPAPTMSGSSPVGAVGSATGEVTLADIHAALPDNTVGAIDARDLRDIMTVLWNRIPVGGQVASDGTLVHGPTGWSAEYDPATRLYTVHHTLATDSYSVVINALTHTDASQVAMIESTTETSFTYGVWHSGVQELHGTYANFIVAVQPS